MVRERRWGLCLSTANSARYLPSLTRAFITARRADQVQIIPAIAVSAPVNLGQEAFADADGISEALRVGSS